MVVPVPDNDAAPEIPSGRSAIELPPVVHAGGSWQCPLGRADLEEKCLDCTTRAFDGAQARTLFAQLWVIADLASVNELRAHRARNSAIVQPRLGMFSFISFAQAIASS